MLMKINIYMFTQNKITRGEKMEKAKSKKHKEKRKKKKEKKKIKRIKYLPQNTKQMLTTEEKMVRATCLVTLCTMFMGAGMTGFLFAVAVLAYMNMLFEYCTFEDFCRRQTNAKYADHIVDNTTMSSIRSNLNRYRFEAIEEVGDGNCLFRAVARQVYGSPQLHRRVRNETCNYISSSRERFRNYILYNNVDDYLFSMRQSNGTFASYGGHPEIVAMQTIYGRDIHVWENGVRRVGGNIYGGKEINVEKVGVHYNTLIKQRIENNWESNNDTLDTSQMQYHDENELFTVW